MTWITWVLLAVALGGAVLVAYLLNRDPNGPVSCVGCGQCIATGECVYLKNRKRGKKSDPT